MDCGRRAISPATAPVVVTEVPAAGTDLRDALDRGLDGAGGAGGPPPDVVVTRDPDVLAYAASSGRYSIATLPWSRTYVLVAVDSTPTVPSDAERDALARDAVTADARGAAPPFAWLSHPGCVATVVPSSTASRPVVAYAADDAIARQLAERIVALADARPRPAWLPASLAQDAQGAQPPRVAPVVVDSIADMLATGRVAVAVLTLTRDVRGPCGTTGAPLPWRAVPLVDSRAHVIVRRGSGAAFTIAADGTLRFVRRGTP